MIPGNAQTFEQTWLLLCEGSGDQRFFHRLIEKRNITNQFSIRFPEKAGKWGGGRSSFGHDLLDVSVNEDFIKNVQAILIVSDKNGDAAASFAEVQNQIRMVKHLPVPTKEREVAKAREEGIPKIVVLMLPMQGNGNLETLCLEAAYAKWGLQQELDQFVAACPAKNWNAGKQAKMRIQTMLAATNESQPDTGFTGHWAQPDQYQIALDHGCFDELVDFLKNFGALVAA